MKSLDELKERVWTCNLNIMRNGLARETFGNASGIDRNSGLVVIKPSGVPYDALGPADMVVVDMNNVVVEGSLRPSSDTRTHLALYRNFPDIGGVVHTHSTYAVAWAQAMRPVPVMGTTHADHLAVDIPCTELMTDEMIKGNYEEETGNQILKVFQAVSYREVPMVLVAGHGPFTWGTSPEKALYHSVILEELSKMALLTLAINPGTPRLKESLIRKHFERKHGAGAYYGQERIKNRE